MITTWLEIALSNALVATVLAALALVFSRRMRPQWALAVWLLVLIKLLTPPIWNLPLASVYPLLPAKEALPRIEWFGHSAADRLAPPSVDSRAQAVVEDLTALHPKSMISSAAMSQPEAPNSIVPWIAPGLVSLWATGTVAWMILSLRRIRRFRILLRRARRAPAPLQDEVRILAERLGLKQVPEVRIARRRISPFVWALFGRPTILLPAGLLRKLNQPQRTALLLHELAHLRHRHHWMKFVELAAVSVYWWLPTAWWARRQADQAAEHCCDALVVSHAPSASRAYAEALLATIDFLSDTPAPLPLEASGFSQFGYVSRRIEMILEPQPRRRQSLPICLAMVALVVAALPLSVQRLWANTAVSTAEETADPIQQSPPPAIELQQPGAAIAAEPAAVEPAVDKDHQRGKEREVIKRNVERELDRMIAGKEMTTNQGIVPGITMTMPLGQRAMLATARQTHLQLARQKAILDELNALQAKSFDALHERYLDREQLGHDIRRAEWRIKMHTMQLDAAKAQLRAQLEGRHAIYQWLGGTNQGFDFSLGFER